MASRGGAKTFLVAGLVTCVIALIAVMALSKPEVVAKRTHNGGTPRPPPYSLPPHPWYR